MARNQEKAKSMFYRLFHSEMMEKGLSASMRRPASTYDAKSAFQAKKYRMDVLSDISERINKIQDRKEENSY
jgi:hypothetical protein